MRKVKQLKRWGIYELNAKEKEQFGFSFAVIHPEDMGTRPLTPRDTDWECDSQKEAEEWISNYDVV